jgi:hypothetical protein
VASIERRPPSRSWQKAGGLCTSARQRGISRRREMLQRFAGLEPYPYGTPPSCPTLGG